MTAIVQGTVTAIVHGDEGNDDSTVLSISQWDDANYNTEGNDREGTGDDDSYNSYRFDPALVSFLFSNCDLWTLSPDFAIYKWIE